MKKIIAISLVFVMMLCAVACTASKTEDSGSADNAPESALALLNSVWDTYTDDEKFPVAGGDFSEENNNMSGPGKYSIDDAEAIDAALGFPASSISQIDDAASLTHMMNANSFTCGVYHLADGANGAGVADTIKENISVRQWMCGFPEKLVIATVGGDYVVAMFGAEEFINPFVEKLQQACPSTEIVCDEPIA